MLDLDPAAYAALSLDEINDRVYRRSAGQSLAAALAGYRAARAESRRMLQATDGARLAALLAVEGWTPEPPAGPWQAFVIGGNTFEHVEEHLPALRALVLRAAG